MQKNKVYTVIGLQGVKISRTQGISVLLDGVSVDMADEEQFKEDCLDEISNIGVDNFVAEGVDYLVEADFQDGKLVNGEVIDAGNEGYFEDDEEIDEPEEPTDDEPVNEAAED